MISGLGLGKFNPVEMREIAKGNSKPSSFDQKSNAEIAPRSNNSSDTQSKPLEKNNSNINNEFNKKVETYSKSPEKSEISSDKLNKKEIEKFERNSEKSNASDIPQMQMLQGVQPVFVNQQAQNLNSVESVDSEINLDVKVSDQNQAVLNFLKAMQENFGIKPHQVMKALGELNPEVMAQSPHQAMTPLFEKLGLQPKQFTKAQILYTEMLTEMEQVQPELFNGKVAAAGVGTSAGINQLGLGSELPVQEYSKPVISPKPTLEQLMDQKIARRALEPQSIPGAAGIQPQKPVVNMAQIFNIEPQLNSQNELNELTIDKLKEIDPNLRIEDIKINPNRITEQFLSNAPIAAAASSAGLEKDFSGEMSEEGAKDQLAQQLFQMAPDKGSQFAVDKLSVATGTGLASQPAQLSNENVEKLISGSQTLIQKGGGEMKIQMNPEGLGQIHLKIKVQDGQVGVQMMADTIEAKKLLETSMNDLKLGLAEHKLSLNTLKVDVAEQASQNMNQNFDFKREEARDFLGQFRQFNESFRQGAHENSGIKAYRKSTQTTPDIQPIEAKKAEAAKAGGLYLVA